MAILDEFSVCSLCGGELDRPYIGLSWFMSNLPEEVWKHGDDVMHTDCFDSWEHRLAFSQAAFINTMKQWGNYIPSRGYVLLKSERYLLVCGPIGSHIANATTDLVAYVLREISGWRAEDRAPLYTHIFLRDWDITLRSNWYNWQELLEDGYKAKLEGLGEKSKAEIGIILDEIRKEIPDLTALWTKLQEKLPKDEPN